MTGNFVLIGIPLLLLGGFPPPSLHGAFAENPHAAGRSFNSAKRRGGIA